MDDSGIGIVAGLLLAGVAIVALVAVVGGILWATDYGLEATVVDKDCSGGLLGGASGSSVTVETKAFGIAHTMRDFPDAQCHGLRAGDDGNFVRYHIRTGHTTLYEREGGDCIWDSRTGVVC